MIKTSSLAAAAAAFLMAAAQPAAAYERLPARLARLSPADFASQVHIFEHPLEPVTVLSTVEGYPRGRSLKGARAENVHLEALVDRNTGKVTWQVLHKLVYVGGQRNFMSVQYETREGPHQSPTLLVEHGEECWPGPDSLGGCNRLLWVTFQLPEHTVREIAAAYRPGARDPWVLRFRDRDGLDVTGGLAPAEAAGLVGALEAWQRERIVQSEGRQTIQQ